MTRLLTIGHLLQLHAQIKSWEQHQDFNFYSQHTRIENFLKSNDSNLRHAYNEAERYKKAYFEYEDNNMKLDEKQQGILLEGKTLEEFHIDWAAFCNKPINIII